MCGIAGYYDLYSSSPLERNKLKKMTDSLIHRGPDGEGFYFNERLALGHRRLSIIDLETGDQPMYSDDKSIVIVFNGEIYNYIELRDELIKLGYLFKTTSDTEVIIKSYEQWGVNCQNKFNGMWAFALWDDRKKSLFISRDRIGEKPLYYSVFNNTLIFGSEIKCILSFLNGKYEINDEVFELYLFLSYVPAPYTFYKNILKLNPGYYLEVKDGIIRNAQYWDLPDIDENNMLSKRSEIYETFSNLLDDAVRIRMRSDVPFGAFLSGGLDSSTIVSLMAKNSSIPIETFTIGFENKTFDERKLAKLVANKYHCHHIEAIVMSGQELFNESIKKIIAHFDEPFGDSSAIPTDYISSFASRKVKMVLTGDGGDETLSGYTSYQGEKFSVLFQKIPSFIRKLLISSSRLTQKPFKNNIRYKLNRLSDVLESANMDFYNRLINKVIWSEKQTVKKILKDYKNQISIEQYIDEFKSKCKYKDNFYKLMYYHFKYSLPDDILKKVDRMSMAHSLETRIPFLDYRLIEYMAKVHKNIKMKGFQRKTVLRDTFAKTLPDELLSAPKKGFILPLGEWFKEPQHYLIFNKILSHKYNFDTITLYDVIKKNKLGISDYGNFIWQIAVLIEWLD